VIKRYLAAVAAGLMFLFISKTSAALSAELKDYLSNHHDVKVCVELKNSSGDGNIDVSMLKKIVEEAFRDRKSYSFTIVNTAGEADIVFKGDITEYVWLENDPVDNIWSIGSAAIDAATKDNYARMQVASELVTTNNNRVLWSDKVQADVTVHVMPRESSYELIYKRFAKSVMIKIFRKRTE